MPRSFPSLAASAAGLRQAALDVEPVAGLTHRFYRYPARFSPKLVRHCIQAFTEPGDLVLDPFMGGGTTAIESVALGRRCFGSDLNSLAVFVTNAKLTQLRRDEARAVAMWARETVPSLNCRLPAKPDKRVPLNMTLPAVRWLRKTISLCLVAAERQLPTENALLLARCALLNVGQWALNGRKRIPSAAEFRERVG